MTAKEMTLWQVIDLLGQQMPFSKAKVEKLLGVQLVLKTRNEYLVHWVSASIVLQDQLSIEKINLVLGPDDKFDSTSGATIELTGDCVTLGQVRSHYATLAITSAPRGRSLQEATVYSSKQHWGQLSFAFKEASPDCLSAVSFSHK